MDDQEWNAVRKRQEREALLAVIDDALSEVPGDQTDGLRAEFSHCVGTGGADAMYEVVERIDWIRVPMLYPLVAEHFVHARVPPKELTQRERKQLARQQRRLAKKLGEAGEVARAMSRGPAWCAPLARTLDDLADELTPSEGEEARAREVGSPGRPRRVETRFALELESLFRGSELPMTQRCDLIAAVISAFIEPVSGEQIRQRIKDLRRRPRGND